MLGGESSLERDFDCGLMPDDAAAAVACGVVLDGFQVEARHAVPGWDEVHVRRDSGPGPAPGLKQG